MPGPTKRYAAPLGLSFLTTRGALSRYLRSRRSTHRSPGSVMCESAEITRCAVIVGSPQSLLSSAQDLTRQHACVSLTFVQYLAVDKRIRDALCLRHQSSSATREI